MMYKHSVYDDLAFCGKHWNETFGEQKVRLAVSVQAYKLPPSHSLESGYTHQVYTVSGNTIDEAVGRAYAEMFVVFPPDKSWLKHSMQYKEINR